MLVFWSRGRGYQTILIWLATMCGFGIIEAIGKSFIPDNPWYWGAAFGVAAILNWQRGSALNAKSLAKRSPSTLMQRLFYKARHQFMSMPMETFSLVLVTAGIAIALQPLLAADR